jgi:hypothetical protein
MCPPIPGAPCPQTKAESAALYRQRHPERIRAWRSIYKAVRSGRLIRPSTCENCGLACKPEASHDDYAKRFEVAWLCHDCHITKDAHNRKHPEEPIMTAAPVKTDPDWPYPWPKGGRPPKIPNAQRWNLYVDPRVRERAERRAARRGEALPDIMRALMADYAAGRIAPTPYGAGEPETVTPAGQTPA